jgi:hypothetical protein
LQTAAAIKREEREREEKNEIENVKKKQNAFALHSLLFIASNFQID